MTTLEASHPVSDVRDWRQWLGVGGAALGLTLGLGACSFQAPNALRTPEDIAAILNATPGSIPTSSDRRSVYGDARFQVHHGKTCTRATRAASRDTLGIKVSEHVPVPAGFDATVFLNGWDAEYRSRDHHVVGLGSTIFNVVRIENRLHWDAGGLIGDKRGDDAFVWCYRYTVMMWKPSLLPGDTTAFNRLDVVPFVSQPGRHLIALADGPAITEVPSVFSIAERPPRSKLFMGFAMSYSDTDHHVLQLGFEQGPSLRDGQDIGWMSRVLLQDKDGAEAIRAAVMSTILAGDSVFEWRPETVQRVSGSEGTGPIANQVPLQPRQGQRFCGAVGGSDDRVQVYTIPNVPYRYAVPMLTGWNLGYLCTDHHVKRAGVWIDDFRYDRMPGATTGTLTYTVRSTFHDGPHHDANLSRVAVTVLGIEPTAPAGNGGGVGGGVAGN